MSTPDTPQTKKPWWKTPKGIAGIIGAVLVVGIVGSCNAESEDPTAADETTAAEEVVAVEETPAWMDTEDYRDFCEGDPSIDEELQSVVNAVTIPDSGHVQFTNVSNDSGNPGMITVFFATCSPAEGDDLREIAEDLAVAVKASDIGETVSEMGVNASYANPGGKENILRDDDFQLHLHDNGEARANGAYRGAWEAKN